MVDINNPKEVLEKKSNNPLNAVVPLSPTKKSPCRSKKYESQRSVDLGRFACSYNKLTAISP
jgi:hypothetical protein